MKKLEIDFLLDKANKIHDYKYLYNFDNYENIKSKINIKCPEHGVFTQRISDHLNGHGCTLCAIEKNVNNKRNKIEDIIDRANKIHNYAYDYSLLKNHKSMLNEVDIICPKHGIFTLSLHSHVNKKRGCKYCAIERSADTFDEFINKANKMHDNFYNYNKVEYIKCRDKVIITCPIHGDFLQRPRDHINAKQGCPVCSESKGEKKIRKILKYLNINFESEKRFDDLKHKKYLFFDFYLPDYNICIEFDGAQHFSSYDIFGGYEAFNLVKERDRLKNEYCKNNNIKLLRISYLEKEKDIEIILKNFLENGIND